MEPGTNHQTAPGNIPAMLDCLTQPLQDYMLPELSAPALPALRSANQMFKHLSDSASGQAWSPAMQALLPPEITQHAADGTAMQVMLRAQANILGKLRSADAPCQMHCFPTTSWANADKIVWSPGWPSRYIAMLKFKRRETRDWDTSGPPENFKPALLLDALTWTELPGFNPRGDKLCDIPAHSAEWQGAWCASDCASASPAFACFASRRATEVVHVMHGEVQSCRLPDRFQARHLSPRGTSVLCSSIGNAGFVWLVDVPSLTVRNCISSEVLNGSLVRTNSACQLGMQPFWTEFDPASGQLFAITWRCGHVDAALSFHDAAEGRLLACLDLTEHLRPTSVGSSFSYTWSPSGKYVLAHGGKQICGGFMLHPENPQAVVIGHDGFCCRFDVDPRNQKIEMDWSTCGRYLHLTSRGGHAPKCFASGFIWDAIQRTHVFTWEDRCKFQRQRVVIWPAPTKHGLQTTICLILADHTTDGVLVSLPSHSGSLRADQLPMHPDDDDYFVRVISPCGRLLVRQSLHPSAPHEDDRPKSGISGVVQHIEIPEITGGTAWKPMRIEWQAISLCHISYLRSIAWHPNPASGCMYAVAQEDGTVCLVDGRCCMPLQSWSLHELGYEGREPEIWLTCRMELH